MLGKRQRCTTEDSLISSNSKQFPTASTLLPRTVFGQIKTESEDAVFQGLFTYNVNSRIWDSTTTGSGTVTQANSMGIVTTSTTTASTATIESIRHLKYRSGEGGIARWSALYTPGVAGTTQLSGLGGTLDFMGFGYNGADFGILHRNSGVDTWYPQTEWNHDKCGGTQEFPEPLDTTKLNVFSVAFQYLGSGIIAFKIENPDTGLFITVHDIHYGNHNIVPSLDIPVMPYYVHVDNAATTSNLIVKTCSCYLGIEGHAIPHGITNAVVNEKSGIGSTETNVLTIRVRSTFMGKENHDFVYPLFFSASTISGTKPATIYVTQNATLGGIPSYTDVSTTTSIVEWDTAGTTVTGGSRIFASVLGKEDSMAMSLKDIDPYLKPGDTLTLSCSTSSGNISCLVSGTFLEDI